MNFGAFFGNNLFLKDVLLQPKGIMPYLGSKKAVILQRKFTMQNQTFMGGQICKKEIFYILRPDLKTYRAATVRNFFTPDRLQRCGIMPEEFPSIRVFSADASAVIVSELKRLDFLQ